MGWVGGRLKIPITISVHLFGESSEMTRPHMSYLDNYWGIFFELRSDLDRGRRPELKSSMSFNKLPQHISIRYSILCLRSRSPATEIMCTLIGILSRVPEPADLFLYVLFVCVLILVVRRSERPRHSDRQRPQVVRCPIPHTRCVATLPNTPLCLAFTGVSAGRV